MIAKTKSELLYDKITNNWIKKYNKSKKKTIKKKKKRFKFDNEIRLLKKKGYSAFLKSEYWKWIKELVFKRDFYKCTVCSATTNLEVHHTTYKNHFNEHKHLSDLLTTCRNCHQKFHLCCEVEN